MDKEVEEGDCKSRPSSTLERLSQLRKGLEEEEQEFIRSMDINIRKAMELEKKNEELEERLKSVREEVNLVEAQLWEKEESVQILWETCRRMKIDLDGGREGRREYHEDVIQRTTQGSQRTAHGARDNGQAFSKEKVPHEFDKAGTQREIPMCFAPRLCSSPKPSPIKHLSIADDNCVSLNMESRPLSPVRTQNITGNLNISQMLVNLGPEMINSNNERGGFVSGERVDLDTSNQTDSLRKRRLAADVSDPDLQIITSKQKNTDCVFQVKFFLANA